MLNDPLLPPPPPTSARNSGRTAEKAMPATSATTRRTTKKPATAAKILVTGLSATAVIGMASGYTLAGKTKAQQVNNSVTNATEAVSQTPQVPAQSAPSPVAPTPGVATPQNDVASSATPSPVIVVPVPQATPATPGNSTNNWQQQQSSGSR
jgi:hypothetical protein